MKVRQSNSAPVGVLTKVLSIFDLLDRSPDGLQLRFIAERAKLNKSTAYRFLAHLERAGYLVRDSAGAYLIGPRMVHLGAGSTYQATIRKISRPILEELWRESGETVNLGVLSGREVLYLDVLESSHNFRMASQIGARRPVHCTGLGKAILAEQSEDVRLELLAGKLEKLTPHSLTKLADLTAELDRIRKQGYALDNEEAEMGARCVAAPVHDSSGGVAAGLSVSGPVIRMTRTRAAELAKVVKRAAQEISTRLCYAEPSAEKS